jgi:hypothetical protein
MKKITLYKVKDLLQSIGADESTVELVINNIQLYNGLVEDYNKGEQHNYYLMYQLNNQIIKQIESIKKLNKKRNDDSSEDDAFTAMVEAVKNNKAKPIGFKNNRKDDVETR